MPAIWGDYGRFTAAPQPDHRPIRFGRQWGRDFLALLALDWIGLLLWIAALIVARLVFDVEMPPRKPLSADPAMLAALIIVAVPFLEELIFRSWFPAVAWLRKFGPAFRLLFPVAVWLSTLIFALTHLGNFRSMPSSVFGLAWVLPQLWSGSIFAFARVRLGFFGAFLLHGTSNALFFLAMVFGTGLPEEDLHCVPISSGAFRCTSASGKTIIHMPPKHMPGKVPT